MFTMGNLLTLGLVLVILIVFRQLDRNNRSLDKVRKYGERLREELGSFVSGREEAVKDYAVELDVQQKAAKELLKRVAAVEDGLAVRAEGIAKIDERIAAYDKALEELIRMTGRAQENLERLKNETEFTDGMDKRVKEVKIFLERLEKQLGDVELRFERENADALERTQEAVIAALRSTISDLQASAETAERRVEEHRDAIMAVEKTRAVNLARDVEEIKALSATALEQARAEAEKLETSVFTKLKDQAIERSTRFQSAVEEKLSQFQELSKQRLAEVQSLSKGFKEAWKRDAAELDEKRREGREEWKRDIQELGSLARANKEEWKRDLGEFSVLVRTVREEWKRDAAELKTMVEAIKATIKKESAAITTESVSILRAELAELEADHGQRLAALRRDTDLSIQNLREKQAEVEKKLSDDQAELGETLRGENQAAIRELQAAYKAAASDLESAHSAAVAALHADEQRRADEIVATLSALSADTARINQEAVDREAALKNVYGELEEEVEKRTADLRTALTKIEEELLRDAGEDAGRRQNELRDAFDSALAASSDHLDSESRRLDELAAAASETARDLNEKLDALKIDIEERLVDAAENAERKVLETTERRLEVYRDAQEARFTELSRVADDVGRFDAELRASMSAAENRVRADFALFEKEAATARQTALDAFTQDTRSLREDLSGVEQELLALKERAYDNVSEKLRLFEDDFFKDLTKRGEEIELSLDTWRGEQEKVLRALAEASAGERQALEADYSERLREKFSELAEKTSSDLERLKEQTSAFEDGIREQLVAADQALKSFSDQLAGDLDDARQAAATATKAEIGRHSLAMAELLKKDQRGIEEALHDLAASIEDRRGEILSSMESAYKESEAWQARIAQQVKDGNLAVDENRRRLRELASESDERLAALRSQIKDAHDEADGFRLELSNKTEEQLRLLDASVKDIDRRIKEFIGQTKLFERADELKTALERSIEDFRSDLDALDQRRQEAAELEAQFVKIKRLEDDVGAKMTRFLTEKRRVELMEADFKRLILTSQSVDEKLAQVTASDDTLQNLQAQLRRLEDAAADAEAKYQRIEKKNQILDATAEGIDRNFQALREAESLAKRFDEELARVGAELGQLRGTVEKIAADKEKADAVAEKLSQLDDTLLDLEERSEALQKAREWLARTETRLSEVSKQAQDQVKLMGSLLKAEGQKGLSRDKGAPPLGVRETVVKLAHQGWSVDEIARAVKLSKGEVELILEISPNM